MLARFLRTFYHACWYAFAAVILFTAVSVTLLRLTLPHINNYRENIQAWVGDFIGYPVEIKHIGADWQGWVPHLTLNQISILNLSGTDTIANFQSARISFDPLSSLLQQELTPLQLTITGLDLTIIRQPDGSINIARTEAEINDRDLQDTSSVFAGWLLLQRSISIQQANINFHDIGKQRHPVLLSDVSLRLRNAVGRMQLEGSANLPYEYGEGFNFALDAFGDITTPSWSGRLYLEGRNIYPAAWLAFDENNPNDIKLASSPGTIKLWSDWRDAKVNKIEGQVNIPDIQLQAADSNYVIQHLNTTFSLTRLNDNGTELSLEIDELLTENGTWPKTTINISKHPGNEEKNYRYTGQFSYLKVDDVISFIKLLPESGNDIANLVDFELKGNLINSFLIYDPALPIQEQLIIDSDIDRLRIKHIPDNSVITGLSGHLLGNMEHGTVKLNSTSVDLDLPSAFENPLAFHELNGNVKWTHDDGRRIFKIDDVKAHTVDFNSRLRGKIIFQPGSSLPSADMLINISNVNIKNVSRYMPTAIPEKARSWLNTSLVSGNISSLNMALRGPLENFPYYNNEGQFKIVANVHNVTLDYDPKWIPINGIEAEVMIDGNSLVVNARSGKIQNADITWAQVVINGLNADKPLIRIDGEVKGHTDDAIHFIKNSPLVSIGTLNEITQHDIKGEITLTLGLDIPLKHEPVKVNVEVTFHDAILDSPSMGIKLDNITGTVLFTEDSIISREISANYFNQPVELGINSILGNIPEISLSGITDSQFIIDQVTHFFPKLASVAGELNNRVTGSSQWFATLSPEEPFSESNHNRLLKITSPLSGLSIDFPAPLGKADGFVPLEISTIISDANQKMIDFDYGDVLSGHIEFDNSLQDSLTQAEFTFGSATNPPKDFSGIIIDGQIEHLSLPQWFGFINTSNIDIESELINTLQFDVTVSSLNFLDQAFNDVNIQMDKQQSGWNINLNGEDIAGDIIVPENTAIEPLKASFNKINIAENNTSDNNEAINPGKFPPLQIQVTEFNYGKIKLGEMTLNTSVVENGMSIDLISFDKPDLAIAGKGIWQLIDETEVSEFNIKLNANYLNSMLETFDYSVAAIKDGETTLNMDAKWNGSPMDFSLSNISGNLIMEIDKGQFLDIKPTAGRLFGLLSIQTLFRRLSLDFTDLFSEGLSFDQIEGNFTIAGGNAYTNNLTMTGPSANIDVTGRTGLVDQDYDQVVTVTPQFADSLPVASALFGPIGVGVGAVIFLAGEMFKSIPEQIDKLLRYQYTIKGKWDEPKVEKYSGKSETSG
ncbi:MAG: uncharacterized protein HW411_137 [Gammaproteobacteria bacterium]|nr:uncharacterized protein [Gammaproteobacteria bacterium]